MKGAILIALVAFSLLPSSPAFLSVVLSKRIMPWQQLTAHPKGGTRAAMSIRLDATASNFPADSQRIKAKDMNVQQLKRELSEAHNVTCPDNARKSELIVQLQTLRDPRTRSRVSSSEQSTPKDATGVQGFMRKADTEATRSWNRFRSYYERQLSHMPDEEQSRMFSTFLTPLPVTFRLADVGTRSETVDQERAARFQSKIQELLAEGGSTECEVKALAWYPNFAAYQLNVTPMGMRETSLRPLQRYLVNEAELGKIWRQEAVSMVPVLLLGNHPGDTVLDMCAAPGSKTSQLLEIVTRPSATTGLVSGAVVANDPDVRRAQMMVHRTKNLRSPALFVTNYPGQNFPRLRIPTSTDLADGQIWSNISFDAVLCDVPCSGDGTLRKYVATPGQLAPKMKWHPDRGLRMHSTQLGILLRGLEAVKTGGYLVYSTCSLNPVENEAVVAAALAFCRDSIEIQNASRILPGLVASRGLTTWEVPDKNEPDVFFSTFDDVPLSRKQKEVAVVECSANANEERKGLLRTMFPQTNASIQGKLTQCLRILPHHQDTSAFFVALFKKVSDFHSPLTDCIVDDRITSSGSTTTEPYPGAEDSDFDTENTELDTENEDYYILKDIPGGLKVYDDIKSFYGISSDFPVDQLVARSLKMSQIRYVSNEVASLVRAVVPGGARLRVGTAGVLAFQDRRWEQDIIRHRLSMEGLGSILPRMKKRISLLDPNIYHKLLLQRDLDICEVPGAAEYQVGTFVVSLADSDTTTGPDIWAVVCWRGENKCLLFCNSEETFSLLQAFEQRYLDKI